MLIIVGESASGKSTVEKVLVDKGYKRIVSYTTRSPRQGEINGVDYHFISDRDFDSMKSYGFFAETAIYNNWQYGTSLEDCTDDKVLVATPHGLRQLKMNNDLNIISFYINVPRRDRLIKILQRGDSIEEAYRRSLSDVGQYDGISDEVDFVIHNDGYVNTPEQLAKEIIKIVKEKNSGK